MSEEQLQKILEKVPTERREFLRKLLLGSIYASPLVTSIAMSGLTAFEAQGAGYNVSMASLTAFGASGAGYNVQLASGVVRGTGYNTITT